MTDQPPELALDPLEVSDPPPPRSRRRRVLWIAFAFSLSLILLCVLSLTCGWVKFWNHATKAMEPVIREQDGWTSESITWWFRSPARGEVVVYEAEAFDASKPAYRMGRIVGVPGDRLRLSPPTLHINGAPVEFVNLLGLIQYTQFADSLFLATPEQEVIVPEGQYFVLADNSSKSKDSRQTGFVSAERLTGRFWFVFWRRSGTSEVP